MQVHPITNNKPVMRTLKLLFIAVSTLSLASCANNGKEYTGRKWLSYTAADKKYKVDIPEGYEEDTNRIDNELFGKRESHYIYWRFPSSWIPDFDIKMVSASYVVIPETIKDKHDAFLAISSEAIENRDPDNNKSKKQETNVNGYPVRKCIFHYKESVFYLWIMLVNDRVYTFEASVYNNYNNIAEIERIFTSFKPL
jgi:hypothetical protein